MVGMRSQLEARFLKGASWFPLGPFTLTQHTCGNHLLPGIYPAPPIYPAPHLIEYRMLLGSLGSGSLSPWLPGSPIEEAAIEAYESRTSETQAHPSLPLNTSLSSTVGREPLPVSREGRFWLSPLGVDILEHISISNTRRGGRGFSSVPPSSPAPHLLTWFC